MEEGDDGRVHEEQNGEDGGEHEQDTGKRRDLIRKEDGNQNDEHSFHAVDHKRDGDGDQFYSSDEKQHLATAKDSSNQKHFQPVPLLWKDRHLLLI